MANSLTKNYLYNLSYQLLVIISPLLTTPYVSRVLGATNLGIYEYTVSIVNYFILFGCVGSSLYAQREIAYKRDNKEERSNIFWEIVFLRVIFISISMLVYFFSVITFSQYKIYYTILLLNLISSIFDVAWLFQGLEDFKTTVTRSFIIKLSGIIFIFLLVKDENDLILYFLCHTIPLLLGNFTLCYKAAKLINRPKISFQGITRHIKPTLLIFLPQIAISIYTLLDKSMLGSITNDTAEVAFYGQAEKIVKLSLTIITSMGIVMLPRIASYYANGKHETIKYHINNSLRFVFFLGYPIMFGLIGISDNFVIWFFGSGYEKVSPLLSMISPIILCIGISNVIGTQYLLPTKRQKEYNVSVILGAVTNFILNLLLIPHLMSYGASIASVAAELMVVIIQIYYVRSEISLKDNIWQTKGYLVSALIMFFVVTGLGQLSLPPFIITMVQIICGGSLYFLILLFFKDKMIIDMTKKLIYRFKWRS